MSKRETVHAIIKDNKVVVFSQTFCCYCASAKKTLNELGVKFEVIELDEREDGEIIKDILAEVTGERMVLCLTLDIS